jgi:hypothetical protein
LKLTAQEIALESLVEFCREARLMVDLFVNYDCDVRASNLFENLCKFLAKAPPLSALAHQRRCARLMRGGSMF